MKTKENFKEYLITGHLNNDEIITLGLNSHCQPSIQNKELFNVNIDPFQLDFSQDWEQTSLNSTSFNKKPNCTISPQNMGNLSNFTEISKENKKNLLQETKSKIDDFFKKNPNNNLFLKNNASSDDINYAKCEGKTQKNEGNTDKIEKNGSKLEGTMRLLKNISAKSVINSMSFSRIYSKTNNKILIKKENSGKSLLNTSQKN